LYILVYLISDNWLNLNTKCNIRFLVSKTLRPFFDEFVSTRCTAASNDVDIMLGIHDIDT